MASPLAVLNVSYYLTEVNGPGEFSGADLLVIDEVDSLEDELMNYVQFSVSEKQLGRLGLSLPHDTDKLQEWLVWGDTVRLEIETRSREHQRQLRLIPEDQWGQPQLSQQKEVTQLKRFEDKVSWFVRAFDDTWIFYLKRDEETGGREWIFKPIFISNYTDRFLWRHATQFLGMSATIFDPHIVAGTLEGRIQA
ncbi:unnamed protein product, partial [marine sediment metagenome]